MIQCACILHNMLITTWIDVLDPAELEKIMERERRMRRRRTVDDGRADVVLATHARRERIVNEMLELEDPEVDLESCRL